MRHKMLSWSIVIATSFVGLLAGWGFVRCVRYLESELHPTRKPIEPADRERARVLGFQDVRFKASDGIDLSAWYRQPTNGAVVVLLHGVGENRTQLLPEAEELIQKGFG